MDAQANRPKAVAIAKWGAACQPCASAKAKCMRSSDAPGSKCDRCERLEKDCIDQIHKPRKKRQSKPSKTAQLEERLNSLVDLLRATNSGELPPGLSNPNLSGDTGCIPEEAIRQNSEQTRPIASNETTPTAVSSVESVETVPATYNEYAPPTCTCRAPVGELPVPNESDETLLSVFVNKLSPVYPFVILRPGISVQELEATRPFLFSTIKMVASVRHLRSMRAQSYLVMKHFADHMMMRSERSLELLQAILLVVGYYHYHCIMHSQMSNLTYLANALVADLGLNRTSELQERTRMLVLNPQKPNPRTNDERRALCGVWYLSSVVSLAFQRIEQPRYTPYLDQCVRELETAKEYETDSLLVQLVRIQHLTDRIAQVRARDRWDDEVPGIPRAPVGAYLNAFQQELDKYKAQVPRHLKSNKLLMIHYHTAAIRLWEPPALDASLLESLSNSMTTMSLGAPSTLDILFRSSAALKTWFEFWLSIEITDYFYLPMPCCAQLIAAVTYLSRWARLSSSETPHGRPDVSVAQRAVAAGLDDPSSPSPLAGRPDVHAQDLHPDLAISKAMATIKAQIAAQPELQIDVVGVLRALVSRFEEARIEVNQVQGGEWENNIWELAAKKISITRLKLERWAEIVSTVGVEGILLKKYYLGEDKDPNSSADESAEESTGSGGGQASAASAATRPGPMEGIERHDIFEYMPQMAQMQQDGGQGWQYNGNLFAQDLFDGMGLGMNQNFFYDDSPDYSGNLGDGGGVGGGGGGTGMRQDLLDTFSMNATQL